MEDVYQQYKGKVNFLYVYGSEAHPEEYPFQKGAESTDLGWKYRYNVTQSVKERAERAVLWKEKDGPKREMPMIIDFINTPGQTNNAIKKAYIGSGYYSGYVIDCDGHIKVAEGWAWFAPGKDWWGLPLAPISKLTDWLDSYLANPPACYGNTSLPPGQVPGVPTDPPTTPAPVDPSTPPSEPGGGSGADGGGCAIAAGGGHSAPQPMAVVLALLLGVWLGRRRRGRCCRRASTR